MAYTDADVAEWITAAATLHENTMTDELARDVRHAGAMLMSGSGFLDAPTPVLEMFTQLLEAGYAQALRDVRDGKYDADITAWRR